MAHSKKGKKSLYDDACCPLVQGPYFNNSHESLRISWNATLYYRVHWILS